MATILALCPVHRQYEQHCPYCETASDVTNQALHHLGRCDHRCKSTDHFKSPVTPDRGVSGKSGILIYYADGTTSADRPEEE